MFKLCLADMSVMYFFGHVSHALSCQLHFSCFQSCQSCTCTFLVGDGMT